MALPAWISINPIKITWAMVLSEKWSEKTLGCSSGNGPKNSQSADPGVGDVGFNPARVPRG